MMRQHPEIQHKAHQEISHVVGSERLPDFDDRPSLPYVEAIYREVMRWMPVTPLANSHATTSEDIFRGYYIPKGCMIIPNVWAMTNDETKYPEPRRFLPERFLTSEGAINDDNAVLAFGFGRRICVGRHFVDATVWRTIACVLASFEISAPPKDDALGKLTDDLEDLFSDGLIVNAKPFRCAISPRSPEVAQMIRDLKL
jgi:cytochrome P450